MELQTAPKTHANVAPNGTLCHGSAQAHAQRHMRQDARQWPRTDQRSLSADESAAEGVPGGIGPRRQPQSCGGMRTAAAVRTRVPPWPSHALRPTGKRPPPPFGIPRPHCRGSRSRTEQQNPPPPPVRRRVVCGSQMASTRQHNKSLVRSQRLSPPPLPNGASTPRRQPKSPPGRGWVGVVALCFCGCEFCYHLSHPLSRLWCWLALACNYSRLRVFLPNPCNYLPRCNYYPRCNYTPPPL